MSTNTDKTVQAGGRSFTMRAGTSGLLKRGNFVLVNGTRGVRQIVRVKYPHVWHRKYEGEPMVSRRRAGREQMDMWRGGPKPEYKPGRDSEGKKDKLSDVTHYAVRTRGR